MHVYQISSQLTDFQTITIFGIFEWAGWENLSQKKKTFQGCIGDGLRNIHAKFKIDPMTSNFIQSG